MKTCECRIEQKTSKNGVEYVALFIKITPNYEKMVILDKAEVEMLNLMKLITK